MITNESNYSESFSESFISDSNTVIPSDEYRNVETLYVSRNGFCEIHKLVRSGKWYVAKCLKPSLRSNQSLYMLLKKEYDIGKKLEHENICQTIDYTLIPGLGESIVTEYVDGKYLRHYINEGEISDVMLQKWCRQICESLSYIHRHQIIHRDIKPENILITTNGQNVKIIDFGYSDTDDSAIFKQPAGTRRYIAPEQLDENQKEDNRADIYSFGVILKEIIKSCKLKSLRLSRIAKKCTRQNPNERYHDADEIIEAMSPSKTNKTTILLGLLLLAVLSVSLFLLLKPRPYSETNDIPSSKVSPTVVERTHLPTIEEQIGMFSKFNSEVTSETEK